MKFKIISLSFFGCLSLSLYSQNNQSLFEELTKMLVTENAVQNQLEIESNGEKNFYVNQIDSLYKVDESRKIKLDNGSTLYILPEDELFFYAINKWLIFDSLEITDERAITKVTIIELKDGYKKSIFKAQYVFKRSKYGLSIKGKKYFKQ